MSVPVSVIVVSRNEESRIESCLSALQSFDDIWVVDSESADQTQAKAEALGALVVNFKWNGAYPKKRQWALENLKLKYDRVFFVDADEIVTPELCAEIAALDWSCTGYFVRGRYVFDGKVLRFGLVNNKLCLLDRRMMEFPVIDDLGLEGMGEIEGHYQPIVKKSFEGAEIGQLRAPLIHEAYADRTGWESRHRRYARWEVGMNTRKAWPRDPKAWREALKRVFRALPLRGQLAFTQSYLFKLGFLDGRAGYDFAKSRARYYQMIAAQRDFKAQ